MSQNNGQYTYEQVPRYFNFDFFDFQKKILKFEKDSNVLNSYYVKAFCLVLDSQNIYFIF